MPRPRRIRKRTLMTFEPTPAPKRPLLTPERRAWLANLKEEAVRRLPLTAPPEAKVQLRQAIGQALEQYGPEDPTSEVMDILAMLAGQARHRLEQEERERRRAEQKAFLLELADLALVAPVSRCPTSLVGPRGSSKRRQVLAILRSKLRSTLQTELTGEESGGEVMGHVQDFVASWQAEHDQKSGWPSPSQVATLAAGAVAGAGAAAEVPQLREAGGKALRALLRKFTQLLPPNEPPPATTTTSGDGVADG